MRRGDSDSPGPWQGLALAVALGQAFLLLTSARAFADVLATVRSDRVLVSLVHAGTSSATVVAQIAAYVAALIATHAVLGLAAFGLARLTERAFGPVAGRRQLILGWFAVTGAWVLLANIQLYPSSVHSAPGSWLRAEWHGISAASTLATAVLLFVAVALWRLRLAHPARLSLRRLTLPVLGGAVLVVMTTSGFHVSQARAPADPQRPNVILVGVDSLRGDIAVNPDSFVDAPGISAFVREAKVFTDTTTPLARTFPSWMSILTGQHPVSTNARFNLMPRSAVREGRTLGNLLRSRGYRSVYATDEVRFANFDGSYGFDQTITPRVGVTDFLLGNANDLPLPNLLSSLSISRWLFPSTYANRAAWVTYRPETFLQRLDDEIRPAGPTFLAVHLTLAHWPYYYGGVEKPVFSPTWREMYGFAVPAVDRQFVALMEILRRKGLLDNAIVVVLSDHGEALGKRSDSLMARYGKPEEIGASMWGHGTSVLSPHQFQVLFAVRGFGSVNTGYPARVGVPASLEDIKPTIMDLLGAAPAETGPVDGMSLRPLIEGATPTPEMYERIRFTETDVNTPKLLAGQIDEKGLIREAASFYEIEPKRGWSQLRSDRLPILIDRKQRAAMLGHLMLAAIPRDAEPGRYDYILLDRELPIPRRLNARPDPAAHPEASRLWDALHERFPGELEG